MKAGCSHGVTAGKNMLNANNCRIMQSAEDSKLSKQCLISLKMAQKKPLICFVVDVKYVIWLILIQYLTMC